MSNIYDNWERLVGAVLKREEIWELCHAPSRTPSISSSFSSILSDYDSISISRFEKSTSINSLVQARGGDLMEAWVSNYAPGVSLVLGDLRDGTRVIIVVGFSQRRFNVHQAQAWWLDKEPYICGLYNAWRNLPRVKKAWWLDNIAYVWGNKKSLKFKGSDDLIQVEWIEQYAIGKAKQVDLRQETRWPVAEYNGTLMLTLVKDPILEFDFDEILRSGNAGVIEQCERGVYLSLKEYDGIRDVERVRFSGNIFTLGEAVAWWIKNRAKVLRRYRRP